MPICGVDQKKLKSPGQSGELTSRWCRRPQWGQRGTGRYPVRSSSPETGYAILASALTSARLASARPLGGGGFRSRRRRTVHRGGLGRRATAALDGGAAARLTATATTIAATEQSMRASVPARATAAGLDLTSAAGLFDHAAGRFFHSTTAAGLSGTTAAWLSRTAAAAVMTTAEQPRVGLALQRHRHSHDGHHTQGGTQHRILTHRKSSKRNQKHFLMGNRTRFLSAAKRHQKLVDRSGSGPRPFFLRSM